MKKIFTFIVTLAVTIAVMAQMPSTMQFVGPSNYSATIMGVTASGGSETDTLAVSNITAASSDIAIPAMNVTIPNMFSKTIPGMNLTNVPFTMSMAGGMSITWAAESLEYTVMDGGEEKHVVISDLSGSYTTASGLMNLSFNMKYGSMPGIVAFSMENAVYQKDATSISDVTATHQGSSPRKAIVNGKLIITNGDKQYDASGYRLK